MAALRKQDAPASFFSSPSRTLKNLVHSSVGVFPRPQKPQRVEDDDVPHRVQEAEPDNAEPVRSDNEDESSAEEGVDTDYSFSSDDGYSRPRIREDLLPHDFFEWQKSSPCGSVARSAASEASSSSKEAESLSEGLSSQERHFRDGRMKSNGSPSPVDVEARASSAMESRGGNRHLQTLSRQEYENASGLKLRGRAHGSGYSRIAGYGEAAGLGGLPEDHESWKNGAAGAADSWKGKKWRSESGGLLREIMQDIAGAGDGGEIDMKLYQNLVDMFPLIESFMERSEHRQRGNFQHHASMVYTRAPARDAHVKKMPDGFGNGRSCRNDTNGRNDDHHPRWEERENMLRRVEAEDLCSPPRRASFGSSVEIVKLRNRVEGLQRKVAERETVLEAGRSEVHGFREAVDESPQVTKLSRKVEELQREMAEKERMWEAVREKLAEKEVEICGMQRLLQSSEGSYAGLRAKSANDEEEVRALRCEVAALRWQMEVADAETAQQQGFASQPPSPSLESQQIVQVSESHCESVTKEQEMDMEKMEAARKMYLASIVAAKHNPGEECLVLAGELRMHLQSFLRSPTFHALCC